MSKEEFLVELEDIIVDELFIGNTTKDLQDEIAHNMWRISMNQELANDFTVNDLATFFSSVLKNRKKQIVEKSTHPMIFYMWFDVMAAQLRFNLISDCHETLPFGREYKIINEMNPIISEFLQSPWHDGFTENEENDEACEWEPLLVYSTILTNEP